MLLIDGLMKKLRQLAERYTDISNNLNRLRLDLSENLNGPQFRFKRKLKRPPVQI